MSLIEKLTPEQEALIPVYREKWQKIALLTERIDREKAAELDTWQKYTLLKIDADVDEESIYLLKMTCPSTSFIHALRVPPNMNSAREAISWVNWGVDPEEFGVQT
ncbi:hypothetical protein [uncultured Nostoc sp.]|uniref:hypothetical protein n=1 Tax=uncultured Nostoc sp. TaxID=340711 RepID=UPI0035CC6BD8